MLKIEKIKRFLDCDLCQKLLVNPVLLPCGNTICKVHVAELLERRTKQKNSFICELCQEEHLVPENGFAVNKRIKSALEDELNKIDVNMSSFNECKAAIKEVERTISLFESKTKDSENFLYDYFEELKRKVYLRSEEVKAKVDKHTDCLIEAIENSKKDCTKISKQANRITAEIEKSRKLLDELVKEFDTYEINEKKYEKLKSSADDLKTKVDKIRVQFKGSLLEDKEYVFSVGDDDNKPQEIDLQITKIFGSIKVSRDFNKVA